MIVVTCGNCGSTNVKPSHWHAEFDCCDCGMHLQLWQVRLSETSSVATTDVPAKQSEQIPASGG